MVNKSNAFPFGLSCVGGSHEELFYNSRVKVYPDGGCELLVCNRAIFNPQGAEIRKDGYKPKTILRPPEAETPTGVVEPSDRALRRARGKIADIARCNRFSLFVTLTLDAAVIDRYSYGVVIKRLNVWLDNMVRRKNLRYVLIPEHHKDGAIHFHGLFSDLENLSDSGKRTKAGQIVYNMPDWVYGFSVAIPLVGEYLRVVNYVRKYITKGSRKVGGRYYLSGGKLENPECLYSNNDFFDCDGMEIPIVGTNTVFKKVVME